MQRSLLDAYHGAGGACKGYQRAGFYVVGIDIKPQPHSCADEFIQGDVLEWLTDQRFVSRFDAIHASPPCQAFTTMANRRRRAHQDLIDPTRQLLIASGRPWVMENVPGARRAMIDPFQLTGGMFGLRVYRPRLFEVNWNLRLPPLELPVIDPLGVYGKMDGRRIWSRKDGSIQRAPRNIIEAQEAMGIDWMPWTQLCQAIPPAYTEWIGKQLMLEVERAA